MGAPLAWSAPCWLFGLGLGRESRVAQVVDDDVEAVSFLVTEGGADADVAALAVGGEDVESYLLGFFGVVGH